MTTTEDVAGLAATDPGRAIEVAGSIKDPSVRSSALAAIAQTLAQAGDTDHAVQVARAIQQPSVRSSALAAIAQTLAQAGQIDQALSLIGEATKVTQSIKDPSLRSSALAAIAPTLAQAGHTDQARSVTDQALQVAQSIQDPSVRSSALAAIAPTLALVGDTDQAVQVAQSIEDPYARSSALGSMAQAVAAIDRGRASSLGEEALQVARTIADEQERSRALGAIANAVSAYDPDRAAAINEMAKSEPGSVPSRPAPSGAIRGLAGYSADGLFEDDQLNILGDVRTLAAVLASNHTTPPVSVGLFGDWGSGKSFFMRQLKLHIDTLATQTRRAEQAEPPEPSFFCSEIVQIEFNAWHYVDANLWASLVTRIFEGLSEHVGSSEAYQALLGELETARLLLTQTETRRQAAEAALAQANETKAELQAEQRADGQTVQDFVERNPELSEAANQLGRTLGIDQAEVTLGELRQVHEDLRHVGGRLRRGWNALDRTEGFWTKRRLGAVLAASAVVAVFGLRWLVTTNADIKGLAALIGSAVTIVASVGASVVRITKQALDAGARVVDKDNQDRQDRVRQLADAQQQVDSAQHEVEEARKEVERIQQLDADTVYRFIEDRYASSDYRRYLGIVALIQRDFQQLSRRLVPPPGIKRSDRGQGKSPLPRIDRIVLYIDDLDRCPPNNVVKVLQAVHLLLAFPLFVVVVGVDSRWLLRSLRHEYSALLTSAANDTYYEDEPDYWASTPQNYLEKIFQIPYWIRPMGKDGYIQLVSSLIASDARVRDADALVLQPQPATSGPPPVDNSVAPPPERPVKTAPHVASPPPTDGPLSGSGLPTEERPTPPPTAIDLVPKTLVISQDEQAFIEALAPLIPTPRIAKRLINTYRLLRVSEADWSALKGESEPRQYQAALLLLAIMNGFPSQAGVLFRKLTQARDSTWPEFVDGLRPLPMGGEDSRTRKAPRSDQQSSEIGASEFSSRLLGKMRRVEAIPWLRLCHSLGEIHPHLTLTDLAAFQAWVRPVARYSFEAGRVAEDNTNRDPALIHERRAGADETV